jgi:hypothetical protein
MKNEPPEKPASAATATGRAGAPKRAHAINTITLELNAAAAIRSHDEGQWATVFAIHNRYRGKDKPPKAIPISVKFSDHTVAYALTAIRKGAHFTVTGTLDHDEGNQGKDFYRINADQLRVHSQKAAEPDATAA